MIPSFDEYGPAWIDCHVADSVFCAGVRGRQAWSVF